MEKRVVFGIYPERRKVEAAVEALKTNGFHITDISVLFFENSGTKNWDRKKRSKETLKASSALSVLGGLSGAGIFKIPGFGPFFAAGPIVSPLAGTAAVGVGGITESLVGMGIPQDDARKLFEEEIMKGGILLSVHCDDTDIANDAWRVLRETGARNIGATALAEMVLP